MGSAPITIGLVAALAYVVIALVVILRTPLLCDVCLEVRRNRYKGICHGYGRCRHTAAGCRRCECERWRKW